MTGLLRASGLVVRYGGVAAIAGVDLDLAAGSILGLVGANGAGKTTLLDCVSGHQRPAAGQVWLGDDDISHLGPARRARRGVVRSFSDARLFPTMRVADALLLAEDGARRRGGAPRQTRQLVAQMGIEAYLDVRIGALSTGVRKRLDLACMAALQPRVLLLDEPSAGLGTTEAQGVATWVRQVRDVTGAGIVMVEHDLPLVWEVADLVVILAGGTVAAAGTPSELRAHTALSFGRLG